MHVILTKLLVSVCPHKADYPITTILLTSHDQLCIFNIITRNHHCPLASCPQYHSPTRTKLAVQPNAGRRLAYAVRAPIEVVHPGKHVAPTRLRVQFLVRPAHVTPSLLAAAWEGAEHTIRGVAVVRVKNALVALWTDIFFVFCDGVQTSICGYGCHDG